MFLKSSKEVGMRYNLENLKTVQCFDAVELRIPARWDKTKISGAGTQSFWEDEEETGTIFIEAGAPLRMPKDSTEIDTRKFVQDLVKVMFDEATYPYSDSMILAVPSGYVWRARYDSRDSQGQLRNFQYTFFLFRANRYATAQVRLVLPFEVLNDEEFLDLLGIMDREILAARIDPFNGLKRGTDSLSAEKDEFFPERAILNLVGKVKFVAPEQLTGYADLENRWYFRLEPDDVAARLWVSVTEFKHADKRLMESWTKTGMRAVRRMIPGITDNADWQYNIDERPNGFVLHAHLAKISDFKSEVHSEPGQIPLPAWMSGVLQGHFWVCFRFNKREARMAQFILPFSDARAGDPKLQALIKLLRREIPKTILPEFE
jgi:hypothetical protein